MISGHEFDLKWDMSASRDHIGSDLLGLYGQVTKRTRWMPWQSEAMKDVVICDKRWGADKQALIQRFPNGETHQCKLVFLT